MPDVILTISKTGDLMYDILDIYYYGDTSLFHNIYDCILGIAFLCILISLHCLVHRYFKQHTDDSEQPYSKKQHRLLLQPAGRIGILLCKLLCNQGDWALG